MGFSDQDMEDGLRRIPGVGNAVADGVHGLKSTVMGDGKQSGLLGMGQREAERYKPNEAAAQMPGYAAWQQRLMQGAQGAGARQAPTMTAAQLGPAALYGGAFINQAPQAQFRQGQEGLIAQLQAQANGTGPSLAQGQLQQATDRNMAQALAMGQAAGNNGAAMRNIANQRAAMSQQSAADSSQLRMAEQMQAQNQLGQVLAGARGQDIGLATEQAGFDQSAGLANQGARNQFSLQQGTFNQQAGMANQTAALQQQQMNDSLTQFYTQMGLNLDEAQRKAAMDMENMKLQGQLGFEGIDAGSYSSAAGNRVNQSQFFIKQLQNMLSSAGQGITSAATGGAA